MWENAVHLQWKHHCLSPFQKIDANSTANPSNWISRHCSSCHHAGGEMHMQESRGASEPIHRMKRRQTGSQQRKSGSVTWITTNTNSSLTSTLVRLEANSRLEEGSGVAALSLWIVNHTQDCLEIGLITLWSIAGLMSLGPTFYSVLRGCWTCLQGFPTVSWKLMERFLNEEISYGG